MSGDTYHDPEAPIRYVGNDRAIWATCDLCGTGLRGFPSYTQVRGNALTHLNNYHDGWRSEQLAKEGTPDE